MSYLQEFFLLYFGLTHSSVQNAILQNLEFIADREAKTIRQKRISLRFKITTHENCVAITNHFINH
jgi:hypothetical protein